MSLLHEILAWTQVLPPWQSDAVARLLAKRELAPSDQEDLLAMLKAAHGIADPKERTPQPLTASQIPQAPQAATPVQLVAIKNLRNVNAIAEKQRLEFGPTGLSVIYGGNGSGKSGYSRVLKRACRARDQSETIHPNANVPMSQAGVPEAVFEVLQGRQASELTWTQGSPSPDELSSFSVFDTRCARAYLDDEDDYSYVPYGLDIFEGLAKTCRQLKTRIETEQQQAYVDTAALAPLRGDTAVGKLIGALSAKTPAAQVEALANVSAEHRAKHTALQTSLRENNPKEKASLLRLRARRIVTLATACNTKARMVDNAVLSLLRELSDKYRAAQEAAKLAATAFKEGENLLPGTGGEAWRELFDAARKFAVESHPAHTFPDLGDNSPCPLCQQPLGEGNGRLRRFEAFVQQEAEKTAQSLRQALADAYKPFTALDLSLHLDEATFSEIEALDGPLAAETRAFEAYLVARQTAIKDAVIANQWDKIPDPLQGPGAQWQVWAQKHTLEADTLEQAADEAAREKLHQEFQELDARLRLEPLKAAVLSAIDRLNLQAKLAKCLSALGTQAISRKASEMSEKVVSQELADALTREFAALGVDMLSVALQSRADRGKTLHKLKLELPQKRNPGDILSEGEQRAVALASFLAEIGLSGGTGGILFDDPVSSLDHRRRERVAQRLISEARKRQVIVFTHDIYFLFSLLEQAQASGVSIATQSLIRRPEGYGVADSELPFEARSTTKRIGALKAQQQTVAKLYNDGDEESHRKLTIDAYFRLRMAWERAVEEVLFAGVVARFQKGVSTLKLAGVTVDDDDYARVTSGMTKCSYYAHDRAATGGETIPDPLELLADINALDAWRSHVDDRGKSLAAKRKAAPTTPAEPV
ncbi:TPA: AAA family ATPase [Stenotrophomonas maltophilia]|nr:AAA family ATPase [Stenotrophomonas maltophilia]